MTYKNIILDESILDIDSWLPEKAIDEIVEYAYQCTQEEAKKHPQFRWVPLEEL